MSALLLSLMLAATPAANASLQAELDKFHQAHIADLKEEGWLNLVARAWIKEGANSAGSAKGSVVKLPASAPANFGVFTRAGKNVSFQPAAGVTVRTADGKPFPGGPMLSDEQSPTPTELRSGTLSFHIITRQDQVGVRVKDSEAPNAKNFRDVPLYPANPKWVLQGKLVKGNGPKQIAMQNVLGQTQLVDSPGTVEFTLDGKRFHLAPTASSDGYFFVFADLTNIDTTYGAGRFLQTGAADASGNVTLDFNRAYNPPCAFTAFATCPIPPKENRLDVRVEAGEKRNPNHP